MNGRQGRGRDVPMRGALEEVGPSRTAVPVASLDGPRLTLALVEAHLGSLVEVLPVAVLVTSSTGEILRANSAAVELLRNPVPLVGQPVAGVLSAARRKRALEVRLRWLRHEDNVLRLYVIHAADRSS